ncbi:hypothetical protein Y032_0030g2193 [Ancylostoma ceylanicum]|uniref:PB1 domain-containing protein n=1 Tax=Ancylostoma ceylanicum TaxID=53326 RepID=A0A016UT39_9BILA|nr:hypothetical protein Y032_0030g2193 [Ancylostoma ceylanicum]
MTEETVTFRFYPADVQRICITYKDKNELYTKFQKQLSELNIPSDAVYWVDCDLDRSWMRTADALYAALESNQNAKMYISSDHIKDADSKASSKMGN